MSNGIKLTNSTIKKIVNLLEEIHEIMFTLNFVNYVANDIEKKFPNIARSIKYTKEEEYIENIENAIIEIKSFKKNEDLTFKNIPLSDPLELVPEFSKNNDLGHMLIFLFKYRDMGNKTTKINNSTLEHTFPQKAQPKNWPKLASLEDEDKANLVYSYGNFLITHSSDNSNYGRKPFGHKRDLYIRDKLYNTGTREQ